MYKVGAVHTSSRKFFWSKSTAISNQIQRLICREFLQSGFRCWNLFRWIQRQIRCIRFRTKANYRWVLAAFGFSPDVFGGRLENQASDTCTSSETFDFIGLLLNLPWNSFPKRFYITFGAYFHHGILPIILKINYFRVVIWKVLLVLLIVFQNLFKDYFLNLFKILSKLHQRFPKTFPLCLGLLNIVLEHFLNFIGDFLCFFKVSSEHFHISNRSESFSNDLKIEF